MPSGIGKSAVKAALARRGYELVPLPPPATTDEFPHDVVHPAATYSPWLSDSEFGAAYDAVADATLVDRYRCHELWQLVAEAAKLRAGSLLEVGVWRGGTGALLAKRAQLLGLEEQTFLCDTFDGVVKAGRRDTRYSGGEHSDADADEVRALLDRLGLERVEILVGTFPEETGDRIENQIFRLCHVDVDVYQSASDVIEWVWPRLEPGGIVIFDDYGFHGCEGVTRFVEEQRRLADRIVIHNLNGHALVVKAGAIR